MKLVVLWSRRVDELLEGRVVGDDACHGLAAAWDRRPTPVDAPLVRRVVKILAGIIRPLQRRSVSDNQAALTLEQEERRCAHVVDEDFVERNSRRCGPGADLPRRAVHPRPQRHAVAVAAG